MLGFALLLSLPASARLRPGFPNPAPHVDVAVTSCDDGNPCTEDILTGQGRYRQCRHKYLSPLYRCEDGDPCTTHERCYRGTCYPLGRVSCDDGEACTTDRCIPGQGCFSMAKRSGACDDGDVCTDIDRCRSGHCVGFQRKSCPQDGNVCTYEDCDRRTGECAHIARSKLGGMPCQDGDICTEDDRCSGGRCAGVRASCDDDNPCTADSCLEGSGCHHEFDASGCVGTGVCARDTDCDDGIPSTVDRCDPHRGCTHERECGVPGECFVPYCSGARRLYLRWPRCGDGWCSSDCTGRQARYAETADSCPTDCAPPCGDHLCETDRGESLESCALDCARCGDEMCSVGETASSCPSDCCSVDGVPNECGDGHCAGGICGEDRARCPEDCGGECGNDLCEAGEDPDGCPEDCGQLCGDGHCHVSDLVDGACTDEERAVDCPRCGDCICSAHAGEDAESCPYDCGCGDGWCSPCEASSGACAHDCLEECNGVDDDGDGLTDELACDDQNPCTWDRCNGRTSTCTHVPVALSSCSDGDPCTRDDACVDGQCVGEPAQDGVCCQSAADCDDDDPCTTEYCSATDGCQYSPPSQSLRCDDGDPCTVVDACTSSGECEGEPACHDHNPCTTDSCDRYGRCDHVNVEDGTACVLGARDAACFGGSCVPRLATPDPNACGEAPSDTCGNGLCDTICGERVDECSVDCGLCGDGVCTPGEHPENCPVDCCARGSSANVCGDGYCVGYGCGETSATCPEDCGKPCGDGICSRGEGSYTSYRERRPDGSWEWRTGVNPDYCEADCRTHVCGDGECTGTETPGTCATDCAALCGDGRCSGGEHHLTCPVDCGL